MKSSHIHALKKVLLRSYKSGEHLNFEEKEESELFDFDDETN
jgi:hypothetical protein